MTTLPQTKARPDDLLAQAREIVLRNQNPSVSLLQRHLKIGYNQALGLLAQLEGDIVTTPDSHKGARCRRARCQSAHTGIQADAEWCACRVHNQPL